MFYEVIFENGEHTVLTAESDEEAAQFLYEHHRRAVNGESATPESTARTDIDVASVPGEQSWPANRIKKVLVYDEHPSEYNAEMLVSKDEMEKRFKEAMKSASMGDAVSIPELRAALDELAYPMVESGPHESNFKMKEARELDAKLWEAA